MPLAEHPFVTRLSRFMQLSAADLRSLERVIESELLVKKRKDLVESATSITISASSRTATRSATNCYAAANGKSSM
jgi:hypothetical protein